MRTLRSLIGTFVSIGLLVGLALSPAFAQPAFDPPGLERAIEAQERHTNNLLGIQGVVGTAVGLGANGRAVVKIYTERSGIGGLPRSLDGVPVRVQVTGRIFALNKPVGGVHDHGNGGGGEEVDPKSRFDRPVPIGVSSGNAELGNVCAAGTLGARVTDGTDVYALSNNHVYALEKNDAIGEPITQPGALDTGCIVDLDNDVIGNVAMVVEIFFDESENMVDAAIASTTTLQVDNATPADGYGMPKSTTIAEGIGLAVQKYGRTTSLTKGTIAGINVDINVAYDTGVARFVDQIEIQGNKGPFLKPGDSGSLLVVDDPDGDDDLKPVGLLFAGNKSGKTAFANPINLVLTAFGVTIDGTP